MILNVLTRLCNESTGLFVGVSAVSFLIPPTAYPARCGLLTTTLLVRFDIFIFGFATSDGAIGN